MRRRRRTDHVLRMHSRLPAGLIAPAAAALVLILSGCGSSAVTIDPVAEAAIATSHSGGAQLAMSAQIELGGLSGPVRLTGTGNFNFAAHEGELISSLSGLPASALGVLHTSSLQFTELFAKNVIYLESPLLAGRLPGGARWMKLDLGQVVQGLGLDPQSLSSGQSNPAQDLEYLKADGGTVTRVGTETLRGAMTTHYRGTIDLAKAAEKLGSANPALLKASIEQLTAEMGTKKIPVEVWVDSRDRVRRMTLAVGETSSGEHVGVSIMLELFNFGATPAVNVPSGSEVFDVTQSSLAGLSAG